MINDAQNDYIVLIDNNYHLCVCNDSIGLPPDYILVELGPHHGWEESRYEEWEIPF